MKPSTRLSDEPDFDGDSVTLIERFTGTSGFGTFLVTTWTFTGLDWTDQPGAIIDVFPSALNGATVDWVGIDSFAITLPVI